MYASNQNQRKASRKSFSALFLFLSLFASANCFGSTITLQWDPQNAPDLAGYKVYYSTSSSAPFTGVGATEGTSPIKLAKQNSATITGLDSGTAYYFAVTAYNTSGIETAYSTKVYVPELVPPTVAITSPAANATVTGSVTVSASASDNVGVTRVEYYVNGALAATDTQSPYQFSWDAGSLASGNYTLSAKAYDAAGNVGTSSSVVVNVVNDVIAPTVSVSGPVAGSTVHGTVPVAVTASDNIGVTKVEIYANGSIILAGNQAQASYNWDTTALSNGAYNLSAKAYDAAGNIGQSASLHVDVLNDSIPPVVALIAPIGSSTLSGAVSVLASASDNIGLARVDFLVNGVLQSSVSAPPYGYNWDTLKSANGNYIVSAIAYDTVGNQGFSANVPVTVFNDTTAPVVTLAPLSAIVAGTVNLAASASDNVGVSKVELYLDGALNASFANAPYSVAWNTLQTANGAHTLVARAYDAAGNVGISSKLSFNVFNDTEAPVAAFAAPVANSTVNGSVNVAALASDNVGVSRVEFFVNGALQATASAAPYGFNWNTVQVANGSYTLIAKAYDATGNVGQSTISVNVLNDFAAPVVTAFSLPAKSGMVATVSSFAATDNVQVTGYLITEQSTAPAASDSRWNQVAPASFTFSGIGNRTAYAWAKDASGNVSLSKSALCNVVDTVAPVIASFQIAGTTPTMITASATDNVGVAKMQLYVDGVLKLDTKADSFNYAWTATTKGNHTVIVRALDAAGNAQLQSLLAYR